MPEFKTKTNAPTIAVEPRWKTVSVIRDSAGEVGRATTVNLDMVASYVQHAAGQVKLTLKNGWWMIVFGEEFEYAPMAPEAAPRRKRGWSMKKGE